MPSFEKPTRRQIEAVLPRLRSPESCAYFFRRLDNPEWIPILREAKLFAQPPLPIETESGGRSGQHWPASKYLARMAKFAPESVADAFLSFKTENGSVIGDMLTASLAMPPRTAAILVPTIAGAVRSGTAWVQLRTASELCTQLAEADELNAALALADAMFGPTSKQTSAQANQRGLYWYREGLKQNVPVLARHSGALFLPKICDWLQAKIQASERFDEDSDNDYSYVWRPAIEEHEQNSDYRMSSVLVGFVRQAFEMAIRADNLTLVDALTLLDRYPFLVFKRLRMHLIGEFAEQAPDLFRQIALDQDLFEDHRFKHEYAILIGKRFDLLTDREKEQWLAWIDGGPDMSNFAENVRRWHHREPSEQERRDRIEHWQFEKLHLIRNHLAGERLDFYRRMLASDGEPTMADLNVRSGPARWGNESPFSVEQLSATPFAQTVEIVSSWKGERDSFEGPDLEGLASVFEGYIATNPTAFADNAKLLVGKPAIFVRAFIRKISDAISDGQPISIGPVLELCRWVVKQPVDDRTIADSQLSRREARDWQWTRDEISRLIGSICKAERDNIPVYPLEPHRRELWSALDVLYLDPEHSYIVHDKSNDDPRTSDYLDIAINSPRGKAVDVALEYARWVANHIKAKDGDREEVPSGFAALPEVQRMLEWQIAPENRTSEALTIIGWKIPLLNWIDKRWLGANADRIFDLSEIERNPHGAAGWAAWNAFLVWVPPHVHFYQLFHAQYAYAVEQCASVPLAEQSRRHPMNHLGEHLMLLYGRGQLGLDDDAGLFRRFLATANADVRRYAISFVGQTLERDQDVPTEIRDRFMLLWDFYLSTVGGIDAKQRPDSQLFGPWFLAEVFPSDWALSRLEEFVKVTGTAEPDDQVVERLSKLAPSNPGRSVRILDHLARNDREGWKIYGWRESINEIIKLAVGAKGEAQDTAVGLIDYLGRRGYVELGELLPR